MMLTFARKNHLGTMKRLLLLFLLTSWTQLAYAQDCDTGIILSGQILNIAGSQKAKASVKFVHAYNSVSLEDCLNNCCLETYGLCSIATFRNQSTDVNCLYFYCRPLSHCKFYPSESSDSFSFPAADHKYGESTKILSSKDVSRDIRGHARSVSPRKGAENVVVSRKGVFLDNVTSSAFSLKNDNTTVKPRKGVEEPEDLTQPSPPVIKPVNDVSGGRPKIKPRKGVEDIDVSIAPTRTTMGQSTSVFPHGDVPGLFPLSSRKSKELKELLVLLQNIFRDDVSSGEISPKVPQASNIFVPYGSSSFGATHSSEVLLLPSTPYFNLQTISSNVPHSTLSEILPSSIFSETNLHSGARSSTAQLLTSSFYSDHVQSTPRSSVRFTYGTSLSIKPSASRDFVNSEHFTPSSAIVSIASSELLKSAIPPRSSVGFTYGASLSIKPSSAIILLESTEHFKTPIPLRSSGFPYGTPLSIKPSAVTDFKDYEHVTPSAAVIPLVSSERLTTHTTSRPSVGYTYGASLSIKPSAATDSADYQLFTPSSEGIPLQNSEPSKQPIPLQSSAEFPSGPSLSIKPSATEDFKGFTPSPFVSLERPNPSPTYVPKATHVIIASKVGGAEISKDLNHGMPLLGASIETESERRYRSSMHLVISLVFGLIVLCAVLGVVAKRIYDIWLRRHYHRMDFLIDGMYDGYS